MRKGIAAFICLIMALSLMPFQASAEVKSKVQIQIGKPSVWSLAQAHYLLARMHKDNRNLSTRMPTEKELDPNAINTTRLQLLRTLLDTEGQYSEKVGAENQSRQREEQFALRQREEARAELDEKEDELNNVNADLRKLKRTRARKQADYDQREAERLSKADDEAKPPVKAPLPDQAQKDLQSEIKELDARIANKEDEKQGLEEEIGIAQQAAAPAAGTSGTGTTQTAPAANASSLRARANASVPPPSYSEVSLGNSASLPDFSSSIKDILAAAIKDTGKPSLATSIALDNFVGMQYEIIAKRLTLLRDEVGPDERVIFLELPSSIYTVPCKGDDYIAQVQWKVNWYYDDKQAEASMMDENIEDHTNIEDVLNNRVELRKRLEELNESLREAGKKKDRFKDEGTTFADSALNEEINLINQQIKSVNRELQAISEKVDEEKWKPAVTSNVRALDVIPRQSALNVNDIQATVSQKNFMGVLKLLFGLGIRVNYQRQRELYEQYLQQEVFASGFGKGSNAFGWTFGALPGTNRVAPGVRTTYAVLAVPRQASALRIEATGVAYHRKSAPDYDLDERRYDPNSKQIVDNQHFIIRIPNEHTEQFKVTSVAYSSVKAGDAVTVVIKGDYFSPQIGVLVDGVALNRSVSVGNTEITDAGLDNTATSGVRGQYELVSSREIVMKFLMGNEKYVGTPNITLITPEKSTAINYLPLQVNYHYPRTSLRALATYEPMFIEPFTLTKEYDISEDGKFLKARLKGTGLRGNAIISVDGREIPTLKGRKWKLIKEATDSYIKNVNEENVKNDLYMLLQEQPEAGAGHVDQMIVDAILKNADKKNLILSAPGDQPYVNPALKAKVKDNQPLDKDDRRNIFLLFLNQDRTKAPNEAAPYRSAVKDVAYLLYTNPRYVHLHEVFVHEFLIRQFAEQYADRICLKNGVRGAECSEASRRKVIQRRLEELLRDNADPFHQDEPYHNEELYQEIKDDLLQDLMLVRRALLRMAIDKEKAASDEAARKNLIDRFAKEYATAHLDECKAAKSDADKPKCEPELVAKRTKELNNLETLYQAIRSKNTNDYERLLQTIRRKKAADTRGDSILSDADRTNIAELEGLIEKPMPSFFDEATARQDALNEIESIYEYPGPDEEYARQESTKAYTVRFLGKSGKPVDIRYRQKTSSSFDTEEVTLSKKADPTYGVVRYLPNVGGNKALVDIRFFTDSEKIKSINLIDPETGTKTELKAIREGKDKTRASFKLAYQEIDRGRFAERDRIWIALAQKPDASGDNPDDKNFDIALPVVARITRFANTRTGKPEGYADEQALITIRGYNLQTVAKALFGGKEATIIGKPDFNSVVIQAPKGEPVAKGEAAEVTVVLLSDDGAPVASPLFYTYLGPPSPVVIYHPRRNRQVRRPYATVSDDESYVDADPDAYADAETRPQRVARRRQ
jgi:hypothetical protein